MSQIYLAGVFRCNNWEGTFCLQFSNFEWQKNGQCCYAADITL